MDPALQSQLITIAISIAVVAFIVYRRLLPQPVRSGRTITTTILIVGFSLLGMLQNPRVLGQSLFFVLAPLMLLTGLGLGRVLMSTIQFWNDARTGQLWMRGGLLYLAIWLLNALLRYAVAYLANGSFLPTEPNPLGPPTTLGIISADLLFISIGLWIARGYFLVRKSSERALAPEESRVGEES